MFKYVSAVKAFGFALGFMFASSAAMALQLAPQDVVNLAIKQNIDIRTSELKAQSSEAKAEKDRGPYDLILKIAPTYEYTEALTLTGSGNPSDKTTTVISSLAKRFSTGTTLTVDYTRIKQESVLSSFTQTLRRPNAALDAITLSIRQALWNNIFGESDRAILEKLDGQVLIARLEREEALEKAILDSLSSFWDAYVAETQLRETTAARDKYQELVKAVRRKAGYSLSTPGELPRLEAEFEGADKKVKLNSSNYLAALDTLRTALQIDRSEPIVFKTSTTEVSDIPAIPKLAAVDMAKLRPVMISKITMENAELNRRSERSLASPKLDLVAKARSTGVDETNDVSFSKMSSNSKPTYSIGVEFEWALDSALYRGTRAAAEADYQMAQLQYKLDQDKLADSLAGEERNAVAYRDNALSSIEIVAQRAKVVREMETAYRQGRTPLVELIRAFNDLFTAQQERARAVGDYMIALNKWSAVRDELVTNTTSPKSAKENK